MAINHHANEAVTAFRHSSHVALPLTCARTSGAFRRRRPRPYRQSTQRCRLPLCFLSTYLTEEKLQ
jgi:hypothetical protein